MHGLALGEPRSFQEGHSGVKARRGHSFLSLQYPCEFVKADENLEGKDGHDEGCIKN